METEEREAEELEETNAEPGDENGNNKEDSKTWYPYITKAQFEKFLARLQSRIPEEIDRDYVRAIIRTPSMIYRFLRGIEAMKLIDRDQKPTPRLQNLVNQDSRRRTIGEIVEDLYPDLLKNYQADGGMADRDIVSFFRKETGMGNDSANKMKMFFKYLISCTDFGGETNSENSGGNKVESIASQPVATSSSTRERSSASKQSQHQRSQDSHSGAAPNSAKALTEAQRAYLDTLKSVLKVNIDGDWDDDMIKLAFDRLERLFDRIRRG